MAAEQGDFKLIRAARLIDGTGAPPLERGAILVEGSTIQQVGTWEGVVPPEGAPVQELDYEDKTVLPGLVDCHVHLNGIGDGRTGDDLATLPDEVLTLQAARNGRAHLYSGVTTVRDLGAKHQTTFMLRRAVEMGITPAPRLVLSGRPVAIVGGHLSYFGIEATGTDQCRAAVRQLVKEGADMIKITATGGSTRTSYRLRPSFNVDELKAICDEAHKFGKHAAAHCVSTQGIINALDGGVDTLIHCYFQEPDGSWNLREDVSERIARQGVFVNPTLAAGRIAILRLEGRAEREGLSDEEATQLEESRDLRRTRIGDVSRMIALGVRMACGSDSSWSSNPMGAFQHEIDSIAETGVSPMEAIVSATRDSARSCWVDDTVGTLEPGKQADILVVDGDPSEDAGALWNVADVFLAGDLVDRGNLV